MGVKKYTMESRFSEIIDNPSCRELVNKFAPDLIGYNSKVYKRCYNDSFSKQYLGEQIKVLPYTS